MKLSQARSLARVVVRYYLPAPWAFVWSESKNTRAECDYERHLILLSKHLTKKAALVDVWDSICHEVAHAMTPDEEAEHGKEWKKLCKLLGVIPRASAPRVHE